MDRKKFRVSVMVSELLERAEERKDGTEEDCLRFWRDGHAKKWGTVIFLHGSIGMRVESGDRVGDRRGERGVADS